MNDDLNDRLDYVERARIELENKLKALTDQLTAARSDNRHLRAEDRRMAEQLHRIGNGLRDFLALAVQAADDRPGHAPHAARVRQARAAVELFDAVIGGDRG